MAARSWCAACLLLGIADVAAINLLIGPRVVAETPLVAEASAAPSPSPTPPTPTPAPAAAPVVAIAAPTIETAAVEAAPPTETQTPTQNPRLDVNDTPTMPETRTQTPPLAAEVAPSTAITDSSARVPTSPVIIYFGTDRATLWPAAQSRLDEIAQILGQHPDWNLRVAGHADARGSDDHNTHLSQRRVRRVREYLAARGIDGARVIGQAYGERVPLAPGDGDDALHKNRRVEISFQRSKP